MTTIMLRRGPAAEWTSSNPVLANGEVGIEAETQSFKIGDGVNAWADLDYFASGASFETADDIPDGTVKVMMTAVERAKLASPEFVQDIVNDLLVAGTNLELFYDDTLGKLTINSLSAGGSGTGLDAEGVRDTITDSLVEGSGIDISVDDSADTITISITTVATSQVTGLDTALADLASDVSSKADSGIAGLPAGSVLSVRKASGVWPARPTTRADLVVLWIGADPAPSIVSSGTGGMLDDVDVRMVTP